MATQHIKVYEEKENKGLPLWAWLLPLLLLLGLLAWYLTRGHQATTAAPAAVTSGATTGMPDLGTVHFDTAKATLTAEGVATLNRAADAMKANPGLHLRLEGYTDSTGSHGANDVLSQQRAATVEQFLEGKGNERSRLTGEGFAESNPVAPNDTAPGKADNRRVELFEQK